jgi:hypothetical protein
MAGMSARVTGLSQFSARVNQLAASLPDRAGDALYREMVGVMVESQKIVPYDEGDLHDSGEVDRPQVSGGTVGVTLHYGGGNVDYALEQHQNAELHHPNGGQAYFLAIPLYAWTGAGPERVARKALGGGR